MLRTWLQLFRAPNLFTVPGDPLAGYLFANSGVNSWDLLLPIFRADFSVCENWRYDHDAPLGVPIHVFGGTDDPGVSREHLQAWSRQTEAAYTLEMFEGDHFYVNHSRDQLLARVDTHLRAYAVAV